jgi:hypothetical protein
VVGVRRGDVASGMSNGDVAKIRDEGDVEASFAVGEVLCGVTTPIGSDGPDPEGEACVLICS